MKFLSTLYEKLIDKKSSKKKQLVVIYVCSCDVYAFCTATAIMSMEATNSSLVDNYIIFCDQDGLTKETKNLLSKITDKIIFRSFTEQDVLAKFLDVDAKIVKRFSYLIYAKVYIIDYLKSYKNVLFLGTDTVAVDDISSLLSFTPLAWRRTVQNLAYRMLENKESFDPSATVPNGDFIFLNEALEKYTSNDLIALLNTHKYFAAPCETAFGLLAYKYKIPVNILSKIYLCNLANAVLPEAKIIHAHRYKFWKYTVASILVPEWQQYYQRWLNMGGKPYNGDTTGPAYFPAKKHKLVPWVFSLQEWSDFYSAIINDLPIGIRPSLTTFMNAVAFYIYGKKNIRYYIQYKFALWTIVGLRYKGKITDEIRKEMMNIKEKLKREREREREREKILYMLKIMEKYMSFVS